MKVATWPRSRRRVYRLLRANGEVRERRRRATRTPRLRPEVVARAPLAVWSGDISKLKNASGGASITTSPSCCTSSPATSWTGAWRHRVGRVCQRAHADAVARHQVQPAQLSVPADRGSSMTSNPVVELLAFLGISRSHSRPHVGNDKTFNEG